MTSLTVAIPTGRLLPATLRRLEEAGYPVPADRVAARSLYIDEPGGATFVLVKDRDVPTYVEHGVADAGIVGRDVLEEEQADVLQPLELDIGRFRLVVARPASRPPGFYRALPVVRAATKYPRIAEGHFNARGIPVEIVRLAGSVEIAPGLGLADCIVDVVETGRTLAANGLAVDEVVFEGAARLVVNRASFRSKRAALARLKTALAATAREVAS